MNSVWHSLVKECHCGCYYESCQTLNSNLFLYICHIKKVILLQLFVSNSSLKDIPYLFKLYINPTCHTPTTLTTLTYIFIINKYHFTYETMFSLFCDKSSLVFAHDFTMTRKSPLYLT